MGTRPEVPVPSATVSVLCADRDSETIRVNTTDNSTFFLISSLLYYQN